MPRGRAPDDCPDGTRLLASLGEVYAGPTPEARRRALQRDLEALVKAGRIEAVNPGSKPLRYRLVAEEPDEDQAIWEYNLLFRAKALRQTPARAATGFDLNQAIANGQVDFGQGEQIDLELLVRGYLATMLTDCPLAADQRLVPEQPDSDFEIRVCARVPSTGQLLRWLLGAGDKVEVVAPPDLRRVMAVQAAKMAALYADPDSD